MQLLEWNTQAELKTRLREEPKPDDSWGRPQEQILNNITHDLRAPLCAIMGYLDLVGMQVGDSAPPKAVEYLTLAREAGRRMSRMVNDMLDMFQLENKQVSLVRSPVLIKEILEDVYKTFKGIADLKKINLRIKVPRKEITVLADVRYLGRVLDNLTANALKFTPADGTIEIRVRQRAGRTYFEVADTGRGIPAEETSRIFEKYRQVLPTDGHKGYGMGLAVVKTIVETHGGKIRVVSEPGQGSRFIFWIPQN